ncbi:MAG: NADP-dependent malic enzyme [Candidatus Diapherotrites archaeon]|uniref:NADP-dependent malic enzyme n=1 Tax=Candidatus Iainarchaeum sp. TaxID=3101447 RepID=A0A7J4IU29_9ARCH|nr:MAG: malate dehydrogenase oxaloacetate-decarboxylating [archaeon GW2011_AR10]MBS3059183.1 NADP-dependent malic enzyme [Candidatus Diapherotrites archaeon]HIH07869.1 NADP-dependent malic enzyme [Candidatus Diapherotrites archaeon]
MDVFSESLALHRKLKGKISVSSKLHVNSRKTLSLLYTPGVAEPSRAIQLNPSSIYELTIKNNTVAVVSDGSAVLGLGNIGAEAALPVMEGKAALFKEFAGIDSFPICLKSQDPATIIQTVKEIAPVFGGINLEDIAAPKCFEVEEQLQDLGIPVMHDDQHGTAITVLAAIINSSKVVGKDLEDLRVVISGAGAAGMAVTKLLLCIGIDPNICTSVKSICLVDSKGIIFEGRSGLNRFKEEIAKRTNREKRKGSLKQAVEGADVFVGVSKGNLLSKQMIKSMNAKPIVFAMANPVPEIMPDEALAAGAAVVGTGRSDFPNQINNVLAFPGVFRGALDSRALKINNEMKIAAAHALSKSVEKPTPKKVLPDPLNKSVAPNIARAVARAAVGSGIVRKLSR